DPQITSLRVLVFEPAGGVQAQRHRPSGELQQPRFGVVHGRSALHDLLQQDHFPWSPLVPAHRGLVRLELHSGLASASAVQLALHSAAITGSTVLRWWKILQRPKSQLPVGSAGSLPQVSTGGSEELTEKRIQVLREVGAASSPPTR